MDERLNEMLRNHKVHGVSGDRAIVSQPRGKIVSMTVGVFCDSMEAAYRLGREQTQSELALVVASDPLLPTEVAK